MSAQAAKAAVNAYKAAFKIQDPEGMAAALNFPHIQLADGEFTCIETREDFLETSRGMTARLKADGWATRLRSPSK